MAAAAAGANTLAEVLQIAAFEARAAIGAASLSISRWERHDGLLRTLINVGDLAPGEEQQPADETYRISEHPQIERLLLRGQPYFNAVDDESSDPRSVERLRRRGKESDVAVPIVTEGEIWGDVWASTAPGQPRFRSADVRFLEAIAGQVAIAIGRAELLSRVSRLAFEDELTGLANRRAVMERLARAAARARGRDGQLTLLLADVDELKRINDELGHEAGDRALQRTAEVLLGAAAEHPGSLAGRLSGDEFCVIMENAGLEEARQLGEATLERLRTRPAEGLSLSCGAATSGRHISKPDQLLRAADAALYAAKRRGGGQVCTASTAPPAGGGRDRRIYRRGPGEAVREATLASVRRLDGELARAPALDRLEAVATCFSETLDAAGWTISFAPAGGDVIRSLSSANSRDRLLSGLRVGLGSEVYALDDYPATAALVRAGSGAYRARREDPSADGAERALLEQLGHDSVLGVAAADAAGVFLLELYGDARTTPLELGELELRLVARAAIPPLSGVLDHHRRRLELTAALAARLAAAADEQGVIEAAAEELGRSFGYRVCAIVRLRDDGLVELAAEARRGRLPADWRQPATAGLIGRCLGDGRPVLVADVLREPDHRATSYTRDVRSELNVPIRAGERPWGVINVEERRPGAFGDEDVRTLEAVADQVGAALRSLRAA